MDEFIFLRIIEEMEIHGIESAIKKYDNYFSNNKLFKYKDSVDNKLKDRGLNNIIREKENKDGDT